MLEIDEKLIVNLGQRLSEQNEILRTIDASLQGVESHLRQIAVSSNIAPNYQRPLSEYPTFDWTSMDAGMITSTRSLQGLIAASAPTSLNVRARRGEGGR